ncbi:hypothetical protein Bca4012_044813 [Brassica carinata]
MAASHNISYGIIYKAMEYKLLHKQNYATYAEDKSFVEVKVDEWSLLRFTLLSAPLVAPLVAPLRSSAIDIRAVVRRISSLEDEVESLLKDREIK